MEAALTQSGVRCVLRISRHTADSVKTHDSLRIENRLEISRRFAHSGLRSVLKFQDGFQSGVGFHSGLPIPTSSLPIPLRHIVVYLARSNLCGVSPVRSRISILFANSDISVLLDLMGEEGLKMNFHVWVIVYICLTPKLLMLIFFQK